MNDDSFNCIDIDDIKDKEEYKKYFKIVDKKEYSASGYNSSYFSKAELIKLLRISQRHSYNYIYNDHLVATIGVDNFKAVKNENNEVLWIEDETITSNIKSYTKLNRYIAEKYKNELSIIRNVLFLGKNQFALNNKCNSMLGYCVEYYSKYKVYGTAYLGEFISQALYESQSQSVNSKSIINKYNLTDKVQALTETSDEIIIRACLLKYKNEIALCYGNKASMKITTASVFTLLRTNYEDFIRLVITLGTKTAHFVKKTLYPNKEAQDNVRPELKTKHIVGLADYITEDTLLDIKVTNTIDETYIKQVLAYHYLSTMRSDLHIKRVIVYDATSGRSVTVNITPENLTPQSTFAMLKEAEKQMEQEELRMQEELQKQIDKLEQEETMRQQHYGQEKKQKEHEKKQISKESKNLDNLSHKDQVGRYTSRILKNKYSDIVADYIKLHCEKQYKNISTTIFHLTDDQRIELGKML